MRDAFVIAAVVLMLLVCLVAAGLPYLRYIGMRSHGMYQATPAVYYGEPIGRERTIEL